MFENINSARLAVAVWLLMSAVLIASALATGISLSTDDAMRLAQVRDLLNGQSWFDTVQHRMNTPYGLPMHWSRLVDACIGGLILFFRLFTDGHRAEVLTEYLWPTSLLLPVLLAIARIGARLGGQMAGLFALILGVSCSVALAPFHPGSLDHDNVQLALTLWMMALLIDIDRSRWSAVGAAILCCVSLAIGMQALPYVVVALLAVALWWIANGKAAAVNTRWFGAAFAITGALLLGGATASLYRFSAACDTYSGFYASLAIAGGLGVAAISTLPLQTVMQRTVPFAVLAFALIGLVALTGPECLKGPYANIDPRLGPVWFSRILEVQSPFALAPQAPGDFLAGYFYAVLATLAAFGAWILVPKDERRAALVVASMAAAALVVTSVEVRGLDFAQMYAMPGVAAFVVLAISRLRRSAKVSGATSLVALLLASNASFAAAATVIQKSLPKDKQFDAVQQSWMDACLTPKALQPLATLPRGRVLSFVDQGPYILIDTTDSVVAGPYHRDASGILDSYEVFTASLDKSRAILAKRGINYVVFCEVAPDYAFYRAHDDREGLLSVLAQGRKIAWLSPVRLSGAVKVYRVD